MVLLPKVFYYINNIFIDKWGEYYVRKDDKFIKRATHMFYMKKIIKLN